ncbi:MAG: phasin family protein [Acetobacteraceae bacterium]|nr:phasin family protein [Acetobacteraceae bacterium]
MSKIDNPAGPRDSEKATPPGGAYRASPLGFEAGLAERMMMPQWQAAEVAMQLTQEMMDFMTRRVRAQVALFETLSRCTDFNTALKAQLDFLSEASADCMDEFAHLAKVAQTRLAAAGSASRAE